MSRDLIEVSPCYRRRQTGSRALPRPHPVRQRIAAGVARRRSGGLPDRPHGQDAGPDRRDGAPRSAAMSWSEVDLDRALWSLPGERTKNDRPHVVPLSTAALEVIAGAAADRRLRASCSRTPAAEAMSSATAVAKQKPRRGDGGHRRRAGRGSTRSRRGSFTICGGRWSAAWRGSGSRCRPSSAA